MGITSTSNVDGERVGLANRVFEQVYRIRLVMKRLKARSRVAYYTLSYAVKLGALAAILYLAL